MIEERGQVIALDKDRAEVEVSAGTACEHCGAAAFCNWTGRRTRRIIVRNPHAATIGQVVIVGRKKIPGTLSALAIFGMPAGLLLLGTVTGALLAGDRLAAILGGLGFMLGLAVLLLMERTAASSGRNLPVILRIVDSNRQKGDTGEENSAGRTDGIDSGNRREPHTNKSGTRQRELLEERKIHP